MGKLETASIDAPLALVSRAGSCDVQEATTCDVQEHLSIAVQAILKRLAERNSCDVQEQPVSGVQPELGNHELRRSAGTALFGRGISPKG